RTAYRGVRSRVERWSVHAAGHHDNSASRSHHRARGAIPFACRLCFPLLCHGWRPDVLWHRHARAAPAGGFLCRSHPARRQSGRSSCAGTDQIRNGAQPEDGEGPRLRRAADAAGACRRGDRINLLQCECPLLAPSGRSERSDYLSAFGAKRTSGEATAWFGPTLLMLWTAPTLRHQGAIGWLRRNAPLEGSRPWAKLARSVSISRSQFFKFTAWAPVARWGSANASAERSCWSSSRACRPAWSALRHVRPRIIGAAGFRHLATR